VRLGQGCVGVGRGPSIDAPTDAGATARVVGAGLAWLWAPATALALVMLSGAQAVQARRRYGSSEPEVAQIDVTVVPAAAASAGPPVEMAAFGDSAMAGVGVQESHDTLPVQLAQRAADGLGRSVHVRGYARSGARTDDVLARQLPLVGRRPDISVLLVGTNDVTHLALLRPLARRFGRLLDALVDLGAPVVVCSLPEFRAMRALPYPLRGAARGYGALVRTVQRRAGTRRPQVHLVDVCGAVGREFVRDRSTMSADSFHPSAAGYARIAAAMTPAVLTALVPTTPRGNR
jgi:lysophospholipase L1-like esterase